MTLKKYECEECDEKFGHKTSLITHMKTHTEPAKPDSFPCDICGKVFGYAGNLKNHQSTKCEPSNVKALPKSFQCDICGKELNSSSLQYHKKVIHKTHKEKTIDKS